MIIPIKAKTPLKKQRPQLSYQSQLWRHGSAISRLPILSMDTFALWGDKVKAQFMVASPSSALDVRTHFFCRNQQSGRLVNGQYTKQRRQYIFFPSAAQVVVASSPFRVGPFSLTSLNGGMRENKRNTVDKNLPPTFSLKLHGWCLRRISSFDRRGLCPEINSGMVIVHDAPPPQNNNEYVQGS